MRYILSIIFCLMASCAVAAPPGTFMGVVTHGSGTADYCSDKIGSWDLYYDVDHPSGATTACISGSTTTVTYTSTTPTTCTSANTTSGGTYGFCIGTDTNKYVEIPATGITTQNGRIEFDITMPETLITTTNTSLFEWWVSTTEGINAYLVYTATNQYKLAAYHRDGSNVNPQTSYITVTPGQQLHAAVDWNSSTGYVRVELTGATTGNSPGTLSAFTTPSTGVRFGEFGSSVASGNYGIDNIEMGASQQ